MLPWTHFAEFVNLCFGPPIQLNPLEELKALQCTNTVEEYRCQFLILLCRCDGPSPDHQMNLFTAGLDAPMTSDVEMQKPRDLQATMSLTRAFEHHASAATSSSTSTLTRAP
jgi:hypothetical protein